MMMKTSAQATPTTLPARIWGFLTDPHPSVHDVGENRRAQLVSSLSLILVATLIIAVFASSGAPDTYISFFAIALSAYILGRSKLYRLGAYFFSFGFTSVAYITIYLGTAHNVDAAISSIVPMSLILASALLSQRGFLLLSIAVVLATFGLPAFADPKYLADPNFNSSRTGGAIFSAALVLYGITVFRSRIERERVKQVSDSNRELEKLTDELERRVDERATELDHANKTTSRRAAQLETIAELSQAISHMQNPNEIFSAASQLISERFGFYHVGIFLIDHDREYVVLQAANSAGGQKMLERGHRLAMGTGVVGFAAQARKPRLALDVGADSVFFNNPDLPDTRSEIALPLLYGEQAIGVLDVQSTESGAFTEDDFRVLGTLANQLTTAIENARLLSEARSATRQVEEVYNEFVRTQWSRASERTDYAGFRYNAGRIEMVAAGENGVATDPASKKDAQRANQTDTPDGNRGQLFVSVKLRGEVIGMLQVESSDPSKIWQADDRTLIEAVAERAALALENARLFQDARRRAAKERMIAEATTHISSSMNVENILQATAAELERVLGGSEVLIRFSNKDTL